MIYLRLLGLASFVALVLYYYEVIRGYIKEKNKKKIEFKKAIIPFYYWFKNN